MKRILIVILFQASLITVGFSQSRGGNPKFDPDTNPYEKIIKDPEPGKRTAKFFMNFNQPLVLRDYFDASPCNDYVNLSNVRIKQFNEFVDAFLKGGTDAKQMAKAENDFKKKGVKSQLEDIDYHIGFIEKQGTFANDANTPIENLLCRAKGSLQAIKSTVTYLEAIKKLFPAVEGLDEAIEKGKNTILAYPDNKSLLAIINKHRQ